MTAAIENVAEPPVCASTRRVRRHRKRRRDGLLLFTIEVPEVNIEQAIARELLKPEDRSKPWPALQACYAAQLSDVVLDWLVNGRVITREQRGDAVAILRSISAWLEQADHYGSNALHDINGSNDQKTSA